MNKNNKSKLYDSLKDKFKKEDMLVDGLSFFKHPKISFCYLNDLDIDLMNSFCYFCGEDVIVEKHHVIPREMAHKVNKGLNINDDEFLLPLCPNHHYVLHRGLAGLYFYAGNYYLGIKGRCILMPYSLHNLIKRRLTFHPSEINYSYQKGYKRTKFSLEVASEMMVDIIEKYFNTKKVKGISRWRKK